MFKRSQKILIFFLLPLLMLASSFSYLLATEQGSRLLFSNIEKLTHGKLKIQNLHGTLLDSIDIDNLYIKIENHEVTINKIHMEWQARALLLGKIVIKTFYASDIEIKNKIGKVAVINKKSSFNFSKLFKFLEFKLSDIKLKNIIWQKETERPIKILGLTIQLHTKRGDILDLKAQINSLHDVIIAQGTLQKKWDISWQLHIFDMGYYYKKSSGSITFNGKVSGDRKTPNIFATISLDRFRFNDLKIKAIKGETKIDGSFKTKSMFKLIFNTLKLDNINCNQIIFSGDLTLGTTKPYDYIFNLNIDGTILSFINNAKNKTLKLKQIDITGFFNKKELAANGALIIAHYNPLKVAVKITQLADFIKKMYKTPFWAQVLWQTNNIDFIQHLIPYIKNVSGQLNLAYTFDGSLEHPQIIGKAALFNAQLYVPDLKLKLQNIVINILGVKDKLKYDAHFSSGNGNLNLAGELLYAKGEISSRSLITGTNFLVADTPEYKIFVTPNLACQTKKYFFKITGDIFIPKATIQPVDLSSGGLLPTEIIYVKEKDQAKKEAEELNLHTNIKLGLGDNVYINAMDLQGKLQGSMQIIDEPRRNTLATGKLYIKDGIYSIYGQQLKVNKGNIDFFGGSITNPSLYIEIIRNIKSLNTSSVMQIKDNKLVVGIRAEGMLENVKTDLFSLPSGLAKSDILSYLIIGEPGGQITDNNAQLLLQAASALNLGGPEVGNWLGNLRKKLGLSELGLMKKSSHDQTTAKNSGLTDSFIVLGKFLTPKLYISYSMGLIEPTNILRIRHYINKYLFLQTGSSSTESSINLFYSIERD